MTKATMDTLSVIPDTVGETTTTIVGNKVVFATIEQDQDMSGIFGEGCANGEIFSFCRDHSNYIGNDAEDRINDLLTNHEAVALSYFEHGSSLWMVKDGDVPAGVEFQFDGVKFAGLWVPDEDVLDNIRAKDSEPRKQELREYCQGVLEQYNQWCNGDVYGYIIEVYPVAKDGDGDVIQDRKHYRKHKEGDEDSRWGYYGMDEVREQAASALKHMLGAT